MKLRHSDLPIGYICRLLGKTQQTYYYHVRYQAQLINQESLIITKIISIRQELPGVGVSKLLHILNEQAEYKDICPGRDKLYDLLRRNSLLLLRKSKRGPTTTNSHHRYKMYPNLIKNLQVTRPNFLWVSDITYLSTYDGFCYLSLVTDAYSHRIMGYHVHYNLTTYGPATALRMALSTLDLNEIIELFHHSDRGSQYCSEAYVQLLSVHTHIKISMTENGDPYENAIAERINGILKNEFQLDQLFPSMSAIKAHVIKSIDAYNAMRPHASCDYLTPNEAHGKTGIFVKRWKNYYEKKAAGNIELPGLAAPET